MPAPPTTGRPRTRILLDVLPFSLATALSFALASLLIELTPGPNMTYLALVAASRGRRVGFMTVLGVAAGLAVVGLIAAVGVAEIVQASAPLYEALRWAGVFFMLYLAWEGWTGGGDVSSRTTGEDGRYFRRGLITNLLNPKAAVFYVAILPTFIEPDRALLPQTVFLSGIYVAVATLVHAMIVVLAGTLAPVLNDPRRERPVRRVLSALLALVAIWFAISTAR
ncbi:MAG: LysE family translocator [Alphaproteobacteria bacterium]|nr:LysE family translocator [Alphaproteobacteria bacterium]